MRDRRNLTEAKKDITKQALEQFPAERDSLGLFYANPNGINEMVPMVGPLHLNNEPLASIYTGAPEPASGTLQTPFLGGSSINLVKN